ncbi:MAG: T9SS type A sorting domain-containing protein [Bacteroidetes bacterium]|nr:T9SS type A sorting domain-containing protein [Bacteroidota bacterium]
MKNILFLLSFLIISYQAFGQVPIFKHLSAIQSDSLIQANPDNPNFVILDVRTPNEHIPQHLEGAINRNFYDSDFVDQLDLLNKQKMYLIHCKAGGRSASAFNSMMTMDFVEVYNMAGGINAWNDQSLPTTHEFAPKIMLVSDSIIPHKIVNIGELDSIAISLTNGANNTLKFTSVTSLEGSEFYTDFEIDNTLLGAEDYTFHVFFEPVDELFHTFQFSIESNAGTAKVSILRSGNMVTTTTETIPSKLRIYPNPASDYIYVGGLEKENGFCEILNSNGGLIYKAHLGNSGDLIDVSLFQKGIYFVRFFNEGHQHTEKLLIK